MSENASIVPAIKTFETAFDKAQMAYIQKYPELVIEKTPWETLAICNRCHGSVPIKHSCLFYSRVYPSLQSLDYYQPNAYNCPNCEVSRQRKKVDTGYRYEPIPHYIMRRRKLVLAYKETRKLFKTVREISNYIEELEVLKQFL